MRKLFIIGFLMFCLVFTLTGCKTEAEKQAEAAAEQDKKLMNMDKLKNLDPRQAKKEPLY